MDGRRVIGVLIGLAVLTGCSAKDSATPAAAPAEQGSDSAAGGSGGGGGAAAKPPAPEQQVNQPGVDRKLIRTASLDLSSPDVVKVTDEARRIAADLGGYAGQEEVRGDAATLTLHIPSNQFDKALAQLSGLVPPEGVRGRSQSAQDVTEQLVDVESRIATQRTSVERVRGLLAKAQTVNEIVQIESEVTRREADLESLEKRRETLSGQVALSTVTLKVSKGSAPAPAKEEGRSGFVAGVIGGWDAFLTTGGVVLRVLGAVLPFLIVLGPLGVLALRWRRRRQRGSLATTP